MCRQQRSLLPSRWLDHDCRTKHQRHLLAQRRPLDGQGSAWSLPTRRVRRAEAIVDTPWRGRGRAAREPVSEHRPVTPVCRAPLVLISRPWTALSECGRASRRRLGGCCWRPILVHPAAQNNAARLAALTRAPTGPRVKFQSQKNQCMRRARGACSIHVPSPWLDWCRVRRCASGRFPNPHPHRQWTHSACPWSVPDHLSFLQPNSRLAAR